MRRLLTSSVFAFVPLTACLFVGGWVSRGNERGEIRITFNKDVAPILFKNCVQCHRPGEVAPMSLLTFKEARPWARSIKEKVLTREMPPWHADARFGQFANDRNLGKKEIDTIAAWVDGGANEGDPADLPPAPRFVDGWNIGNPDAVFYIPQEYRVPARGSVDYKYFAVPTNFTRDMWVQAAEIRPGARSVVHHILVWVRHGRNFTPLAGLPPGGRADPVPNGLGIRIPVGSDLVFQVHYAPNGTPARDRSYIGLVFAKEPPRGEYVMMPIFNLWFTIPPGDPNFRVEASYTFTQDVLILALWPHMHLRGKAFEFRLNDANGTSTLLLSVPKFDFRWQTNYLLKEPIYAKKGSRIDCVAHFDNSARNKFNPNPSKEVRWGDQMWEEMMVGEVSYTPVKRSSNENLEPPPVKPSLP
ncbi:MAG: cytochrome c [Blastocatellia bacterium]